MLTPLEAIFQAESQQLAGHLPQGEEQAAASPDLTAPSPTSSLTPSELEGLLQRVCARGRAGFPNLVVPDADFVRLLARCVFKAGLPVDEIEQLTIEDLYLACACATAAAGAVEAFNQRCRAPILAAISAIARTPSAIDEVDQQLRDVLLVGSVDVPAKIASYGGQGALGKWVAVVAQRLALMMIRSDKTEARVRDAAAAEAFTAHVDPELAFVKEQYRGAFRTAMEHALADLPDRERLVMRLNLLNGVTVDGIAKMYGVSQSTVSRWLAKARESVVAGAQMRLRNELRISPAEMESLAGLVVSQLDLSLSRVLGHG